MHAFKVDPERIFSTRACPNCGGQVEIWSDEDVGICDTCNKEIGRPEKEQSCLDWCEYADKCREIIKRMKR